MLTSRFSAAFATATLVATVAVPALAVPPAQDNGKLPSVENKHAVPAGSAMHGKAGQSITVPLKEQNGSGESGTATLRQMGKNVVVTVSLAGAGVTPQPAHIHNGTCSKLNPAPKYPLTPVTGGKSVTTVKGVTLSELAATSMAINVHASATNIKKYVACGNVKRAAMSSM